MNYKGLTFDCTMSDFKRWTRVTDGKEYARPILRGLEKA